MPFWYFLKLCLWCLRQIRTWNMNKREQINHLAVLLPCAPWWISCLCWKQGLFISIISASAPTPLLYFFFFFSFLISLFTFLGTDSFCHLTASFPQKRFLCFGLISKKLGNSGIMEKRKWKDEHLWYWTWNMEVSWNWIMGWELLAFLLLVLSDCQLCN